jgi:pilus assembly protein CpaB
MNRRLLTILLVAFVIASACTFLVYRILGHIVVASKPVSTTKVVAAAADIKLGTVLTSSDLTTTEIAGTVPKGAILKPDEAIGRGVLSDIYQGEPILESRLAAVGSGGGLAATIPPGMRACAVKVDDVVGVAGFVTPGMRVDVMVSGNPPGEAQGNEQGTETKTILQNIGVLSAGTDIQKDKEGKPQQVQVVNLLVTPEQAETLSLASQLKIQLVLRNPTDTTVAPVPVTAMGELFAGGPAAPQPKRVVARRAPKPVVPTYSIQVINGTNSTEEKFSSPEGQH